jgi:prepilin-type N-terminal cleavage/methylation domain-containing protein
MYSVLKNRMQNRRRSAFTLVEIMIVVLIIGILLAIAVPNFVRARETARGKACVANLKEIDGAKEQYAMDNKLAAGASDGGLANLVGPTSYIKATPTCPSNGTYTDGVIGTSPTCSFNATAPTYAPHALGY